MHTYIIKASNFQEDYSLLFFISNNYLFSLFAIITALANTTAKIPKILSIARIPVPVFGVSSFSFSLFFCFLLYVEIQCIDIMQEESLWVVVETHKVVHRALTREGTVVMSGHLISIAPYHHVA